MCDKKICSNTHDCTCPNTTCANHGRCCECIAYHREHGETPNCYAEAAKKESK
ncbi:MAG: DUF6485 family protein [Oscillospiraceae bacterium]